MSALIPIKEPRAVAGLAAKPPAVFLPDEKTGERFFGFFTAHIRNRNTRRAYYNAACQFSDWCEGRGLTDLAGVKPPHVAAYIEVLGLSEPEGSGLSKPSVKQHLAALRILFDWLVVGHVIEHNPAHAVRGPKYSQKKGKTPVLDRDEARALLAAIDTGSVTGLRDRGSYGHHGLYLRPRRSGAANEMWAIISARGGADGCGYMRREARNMKRPACRSWRRTWMNTS
jgi:integrase